MKIIFSRKGFDAENGGTASPVMPDGAMLSLPIPQPWDRDYYDELFYGSMSYLDIWQSLKPKQEFFDSTCHLDPDLRSNIRLSVPEGWKPLFGQCDAAETHLENQGVTVGDVFLFFGWFRETEEVKGALKYKRGGKDAHMLYGYLQIGEIVRGKNISSFSWHPHSYYEDSNNTIYVASDRLVIDGVNTSLPGAGTFTYSDELVLTMPGMTKSRWLLPDFFKEVSISCHSKDSFKPEGYFQSVRIGQEFVVSEDARVTEWAKKIIVNNFDSRSVLAEAQAVTPTKDTSKGKSRIKVPKDKSIDVSVPYRMFNDTGLLVTEDKLWIHINEELYTRIKESYDSGKFKTMNDDESLTDLCSEYASKVRKARWQIFVFDYPEDIVRGFDFKANSLAQWDEETNREILESILADIFKDDDSNM